MAALLASGSLWLPPGRLMAPPRRGRDLLDTGIRANAKNGADAYHPQLNQGKGCVPALGRVRGLGSTLRRLGIPWIESP